MFARELRLLYEFAVEGDLALNGAFGKMILNEMNNVIQLLKYFTEKQS